MKRIFSAVISGFLLFSGMVVNANEVTSDGFERVTNEGSSALIDLSEMELGEEYVLFSDGENVVSVVLELPSLLRGSTGWSGGSIPWGVSTLNVQCSNSAGSTSYKVDVRGSDGSILRAYNLYNLYFGYTISSTSLWVGRSVSSRDVPAYATATVNAQMTQGGFVIGSVSGYLTVEVNSSGKVRISWNI